MRKSNKSIPPSSGTTNNSKSVRTPKVTKESIVEKERLSINDILKTKVKIKCKNAKQKEMLRLVEEKEVSIVSGVAGCGKTFLAIAKALELIQDQTTLYTRLVITKPIVEAEENLGFLPGGLEEKLSPHMASSTNIIDEIIGSANRIRLTELGIIVVEPLAFLRGKTLSNCVLVADEMQNASPSQLKTLMTRIGENSKYIISGDIDQSDRYYDVKQSGLYDIIKRFVDIEEIGHVEFELEDIVRNPLIAKILATYSKSDSIIKKNEKPLLLE